MHFPIQGEVRKSLLYNAIFAKPLESIADDTQKQLPKPRYSLSKIPKNLIMPMTLHPFIYSYTSTIHASIL